MKLQVPLNQLRHQSIQSAATGGDKLQDVFALAISFKRPLTSNCPALAVCTEGASDEMMGRSLRRVS